MKKLLSIFWGLTKGISIVIGFLCLIGATCQTVLNREESVARQVHVGMTRKQVEAQLQGWHQGMPQGYPATTNRTSDTYRYLIRYRSEWWRVYVTYDRDDCVRRCEVRDPF